MATGTRDAVAQMLASGLSRAEVARRLGITKPTVTYHAKRLGYEVARRGTRRYDWAEVQEYYDAGHSMRECMLRFGFSSETWYSAKKRGDIVPRPQAMAVTDLLSAPRNRGHIKKRLLREGLLKAECELCSLKDWRGHPITLHLHHVNGDGADNRLENLQLLCPNCHSQTENYAGRNRRATLTSEL